jgi:DnaJ like chaperone protein
VLGLSENASKDEIRRAYRDLAIEYHPDKASHLGRQARELAEARFMELQKAYQELLKR